MLADDSGDLSGQPSLPADTKDGDPCFPSAVYLKRIRELTLSCGRFALERAIAKLELEIVGM